MDYDFDHFRRIDDPIAKYACVATYTPSPYYALRRVHALCIMSQNGHLSHVKFVRKE
jgi:hypothetical protein